MSEINLKLKNYDELTFEITRLNTDKYLLEQKLQQKENKEKKIREYITKQVHRNQQFYEMDIENILEILDKEVN